MSYIIAVIWEVDFVEDLGAVLLDGVHLYHMGRKLPGLLTEGTKHTQCIYIHRENSIFKTNHATIQ